MYSKLLLPLDGSERSEAILPYARAFARAYNIPVILMHAIDPDAVQMLTMYAGVVKEQIQATSEEYFNKLKSSFPDSDNVECVVVDGQPAEVIVDMAQGHPHTLIAMSTHGRTGLSRWYLGNIAHKVLHATKNPLLLIRATEDSHSVGQAMINKVFIPLDGSSLSEIALDHGRGLAEAFGGDIELIRVCGPVAEGFALNIAYDEAKIMARIKSDIESYLSRKVDDLRSAGFKGSVSYVVAEGDTAGEIAATVKKTAQSIVVMSSRGSSGFRRWVLGSTADRVIHESHRATLIVQVNGPA